jgi:hypothetical protein
MRFKVQGARFKVFKARRRDDGFRFEVQGAKVKISKVRFRNRWMIRTNTDLPFNLES